MRERGPKPTCHVSGGTEPGFTLNKLRHDDFHEICGLVERVRDIVPDVEEFPFKAFAHPDFDFHVGDRVSVPPDESGLSPAESGLISGFAVDTETRKPTPFARVNGRLYHVSVLKRA